jgi:hypothetical protein
MFADTGTSVGDSVTNTLRRTLSQSRPTDRQCESLDFVCINFFIEMSFALEINWLHKPGITSNDSR